MKDNDHQNNIGKINYPINKTPEEIEKIVKEVAISTGLQQTLDFYNNLPPELKLEFDLALAKAAKEFTSKDTDYEEGFI